MDRPLVNRFGDKVKARNILLPNLPVHIKKVQVVQSEHTEYQLMPC